MEVCPYPRTQTATAIELWEPIDSEYDATGMKGRPKSFKRNGKLDATCNLTRKRGSFFYSRNDNKKRFGLNGSTLIGLTKKIAIIEATEVEDSLKGQGRLG